MNLDKKACLYGDGNGAGGRGGDFIARSLRRCQPLPPQSRGERAHGIKPEASLGLI